jgi:hypothetical protein
MRADVPLCRLNNSSGPTANLRTNIQLRHKEGVALPNDSNPAAARDRNTVIDMKLR